eukprot:TRINITY_DN12781_c1_g1_i1.p1 TRINITY_DN12781_c1_g1~~TRINITY_DN12781_c1_g1_i1.p1  ORF type:complete len:534 (-),score=88.82 TRINITY_DN12781_c1_g1_i1:292-1893(-)
MSATMARTSCPYGVDRDAWQPEAVGDVCSDCTCLTVVVLGATGDLAKKKTFPALARLFVRGYLQKDVGMIGYGRSKYTDEQLRDRLRPFLPGEDKEKDEFLSKVTYQRTSAYDAPEGYRGLQDTLLKRESEAKCKNNGRLFYLALPPSVYAEVIAQVKAECSEFAAAQASNGNGNGANASAGGDSWIRVIVEKPFGKDLQSAEELSQSIAKHFDESQIYRIDHFLGKELAQNLLVMRFSNPFLSAVWSRSYIAHIQIIMKEAFGTQGRGGYFDNYGIIRDVVQNHLLQILALITMERPVNLHPDDIRDEKTKVIRSMREIGTDDVVIGQYTAGNGEPGYTEDEGVPDDSKTATYSVCRLYIDNERWEGVPMLIKTGKALNETKMEVRVQFKTHAGFFGGGAEGMRNEFVMRLKPKDAMYMKTVVKKPGLQLNAVMSELDLTYEDRFDEYIPEAYERLILDAINGNQQHFVRRDELRASWALFDGVLRAIDEGKGPELQKYVYGSRGVEAGDKLIADSGYVRNSDYTWRKSGKL